MYGIVLQSDRLCIEVVQPHVQTIFVHNLPTRIQHSIDPYLSF